MAPTTAVAGESDVKLIGWPISPFVIRPMIALSLKEVEYEFHELTYPHKDELLLKSNPVYKRVPVLLHGEKSISESMIIVEYIDRTWQDNLSTIMPEDAYDCAIQRFWTIFVDDKLPSMINITVRKNTEEAKAEKIEQIFQALKLLEEEAFGKYRSKGKDTGKPFSFFGGGAEDDNIGYLDISLGSYLGWFEACQKIAGIKFLDEEKTPLLVGWAERFRAHKTVKEVMPDTEKLVEFARSLLVKS